ncbi:MAG TPA: creatininase family protein [Tepidisphaeraceae bacterium]|nr:creatininase family protein [Tepidisphaeraceae bacterium]
MTTESAGPREFVLLEANYKQLLDRRPNVAVLPWGATEAHGFHLPHGTDVIEATQLAIAAAARAASVGAKPIVLPTIPFGNDEQQLDQIATISITTTTAVALLRDVVRSLGKQQIDRLIIINGHGGNEFKPLIRDLQGEFGVLIVLVNLFQLHPYPFDSAVANAGDHADEMETSLCLYLCPQWVKMDQAGTGARVPFAIEGLSAAGVWTPRPWGKTHPDTGSGDPTHATAAKGEAFFEKLCLTVAEIITNLSRANKGESPYL